MMKQNCWEYKKCGREPGGSKTAETGVCPAASMIKANAINNGKNGGRACWVISGTFCGGTVQGTFALKLANCMQCDFYKLVFAEEGKNLMKSTEILQKVK